MKLQRYFRIVTLITAICLGILTGLGCYYHPFEMADEVVTNAIYQNNPFRKADSRIVLVTYDANSAASYSLPSALSRNALADAIKILSDKNAAVIGVDMDLTESSEDSSADYALSLACRNAGNVIVAADVIDQELQLPYDVLQSSVTVSVGNALQQSADGSIRNAALFMNLGDQSYEAFAVSVYKTYKTSLGEPITLPELDYSGHFGFNSILDTSGYHIISLDDLLSGNYDDSYIAGEIVLIGQYEEISYGGSFGIDQIKSMQHPQELLTQAAVVQALLTQQTIENVNPIVQAFVFGFAMFCAYAGLSGRKRWFSILINTLILFGVLGLCFTLNLLGYRMMLLTPILISILSTMFFILQQLFFSRLEKYMMKKALSLYVDSNVVNEIENTSFFELGKLSQRRRLAVLFVDIRGFTTISEKLEPEQVVEILNESFTHISRAISRWGGTLDKFIGDAAMALFNAPEDQDDYVFRSICAADDIRLAFKEIADKYNDKYHVNVSVGIGINVGDAIVGNIGSQSRMDYTAIGDTVNTAARMEAKALSGQILVTKPVTEALENRGTYTYVGELSLKGKEKAVAAYQIDTIDKPVLKQKRNMKGELLHETNLLYSKVRPNQ